MFRRPYKTKTSTTVKGSDRRKLRAMIENQYPGFAAQELNSLIPPKSEMNQVKAMTHSGVVLMIYYSGTNPIFFQVEERCYPTVYTLWKFPQLLPTVIIVPNVLEKICNGADLMAPGVVIEEESKNEFQNLKVDDVCAIRLYGNRSAIAVGVALMSFADMCIQGIKGKAVAITHSYKDNLWLSGDQTSLPLCPDTVLHDLPESIENLVISDENTSNDYVDKCDESKLNTDDSDVPGRDEVVEEVKAPEHTMDEILYLSFMAAVKLNHKKIQLPVLTSTFYSSCVLKSCPPEFSLDIKKTTYKKLSVFLKKMQKEGVIQIKELTKGVESIIAIHAECDKMKSVFSEPTFQFFLRSVKAEKPEVVETTSNVQENYKFPSVLELHVVSAQVKAVFEYCKHRKGDCIPSTAVREALKYYAKENSLQNQENPREVILDPILSDCVGKKGGNKGSMTWEELQEAIVSNMPHAYQITFEDKEPLVKKGKLEPIVVSIDTRTGNKKVTLIQNLETYGINAEKLAQHVQVAVAASTSVTPNSGGKGTLVLIQGNQVKYLQKLFLEMYKVPRKYIRGLENVPKKK